MTRVYWTAETTEGFTAAELAILNAAQDALESAAPDCDQADVGDMLNNAFRDGITAAELIAAVAPALGVDLAA